MHSSWNARVGLWRKLLSFYARIKSKNVFKLWQLFFIQHMNQSERSKSFPAISLPHKRQINFLSASKTHSSPGSQILVTHRVFWVEIGNQAWRTDFTTCVHTHSPLLVEEISYTLETPRRHMCEPYWNKGGKERVVVVSSLASFFACSFDPSQLWIWSWSTALFSLFLLS